MQLAINKIKIYKQDEKNICETSVGYHEEANMAIKTNTLKEAKTALKTMSKSKSKSLTKAELVASLIEDIHEKMLAGFKLEEICEEINKTLDEPDKLALNTFKTYVRTARLDAGIEPTRSWTRRSESQTKVNNKVDQEKYKNDIKESAKRAPTESGFRNIGGDL